uniref:Uncharacterized protein n=1 Tax=Cucumis melo TaxID=3656 RepID=A0A9I9EC79_CUCME
MESGRSLDDWIKNLLKRDQKKCIWKDQFVGRNSENLESIIHGYHGESTFNNLKNKCGQLTVETSTSNTIRIGESLFSEEISLPNLEKLKICSGKNLKDDMEQ